MCIRPQYANVSSVVTWLVSSTWLDSYSLSHSILESPVDHVKKQYIRNVYRMRCNLLNRDKWSDLDFVKVIERKINGWKSMNRVKIIEDNAFSNNTLQ